MVTLDRIHAEISTVIRHALERGFVVLHNSVFDGRGIDDAFPSRLAVLRRFKGLAGVLPFPGSPRLCFGTRDQHEEGLGT